jgi:hypothetical protein
MITWQTSASAQPLLATVLETSFYETDVGPGAASIFSQTIDELTRLSTNSEGLYSTRYTKITAGNEYFGPDRETVIETFIPNTQNAITSTTLEATYFFRKTEIVDRQTTVFTIQNEALVPTEIQTTALSVSPETLSTTLRIAATTTNGTQYPAYFNDTIYQANTEYATNANIVILAPTQNLELASNGSISTRITLSAVTNIGTSESINEIILINRTTRTRESFITQQDSGFSIYTTKKATLPQQNLTFSAGVADENGVLVGSSYANIMGFEVPIVPISRSVSSANPATHVMNEGKTLVVSGLKATVIDENGSITQNIQVVGQPFTVSQQYSKLGGAFGENESGSYSINSGVFRVYAEGTSMFVTQNESTSSEWVGGTIASSYYEPISYVDTIQGSGILSKSGFVFSAIRNQSTTP